LSKALLTDVLPAVTVQGDGAVLLHTRSSAFISGRAMKPVKDNSNAGVDTPGNCTGLEGSN
jgi:hypothetical protein